MGNPQRDSIRILLGIIGCRAGKVIEEKAITVEVEEGIGASSCPRCNSEEIKGHGKAKLRRVFHGLTNGSRVYLAVRRQRLKCKRCGKDFTPELPVLGPHSRVAKSLEMNALFELRQQSFSQVNIPALEALTGQRGN